MEEKPHNLEYCIEIAHKYNKTIKQVSDKHAEIFKHIEENYPNMSTEWYHQETERRTKTYFKAYK
jgi:hypothetical protein